MSLSNKSLISLMAEYEPLQKAARRQTGQYVQLPDWMKVAGNTDDALTSSQRSSAKRVLLGPGKIDPLDLDLLLQNRNLDVLTILSARPDLTPQTAQKILANEEPFAGMRGRVGPGQQALVDRYLPDIMGEATPEVIDERKKKRASALMRGFDVGGWSRGRTRDKKKNELFSKIIRVASQNVGAESGFNKFLETASEDAALWAMHNGKVRSGEHLLHMIMNRPRIGSQLMAEIVRRPEFDASHATEVFNRPEEFLKEKAVELMGANIPDEIKTTVMARGSLSMKSHLLKNIGATLSPDFLKSSMADPHLRTAALYRLQQTVNHDRPEERKVLFDSALDLNDPTVTRRALSEINRYSWRRLGAATIDSEQKDRILQQFYAHPTVLASKELAQMDMTPEEQMRVIRVSAENPVTAPDRWTTPDDTAMMGVMLAAAKSPDVVRLLAAVPADKRPDTNHILNNDFTDDALVRTIWTGATDEEKAGMTDKVARLATTPPDVLDDLLARTAAHLSPSTAISLLQNPNISRAHFVSLSRSADEDVRAAVATSPNVQPEDVTVGLQDASIPVRRAFIKNSGTLSAEQWETVKLDRSPTNRAMAAKRPDLPMPVLTHFLTKDKSAGVNQVALKHPSVTSELISQALQNMNPEHFLEAVGRLSPAQIEAFSARVDAIKAKAEAKTARDVAAGKMTTEQKVEADLNGVKALRKMRTSIAARPELTSQLAQQFVREAPAGRAVNIASDVRAHLTPADWDGLYDRVVSSPDPYGNGPSAMDDAARSTLARRADFSPAKWDEFARTQLDSPESRHGMARNPKAPERILMQLIVPRDAVGHESADEVADLGAMMEVEHRTPEFMTAMRDRVKQALGNTEIMDRYRISDLWKGVANVLYSHAALPPTLLHEDFHELPESVQMKALDNPGADDALIQRALRSTHSSVTRRAGEQMAFHDPDKLTTAMGGHEVFINPAVEKLKQLKGLVVDAGGSINKNQLPNKAAGVPVQVFDPKGNITAEGIDKYIDTLPKHRFNVTYGTWTGGQRHSQAPNKVIQLAITNAQIGAIKEAGLWPDFQEMHQRYTYSGHPVTKHTLGWARIDESQPNHYHVDEIQSDFGQGIVKHIDKARDSGAMTPERAAEKIARLKKVIQIVSSGFKNINQAIFAAVHQIGRDNGITSTSMDMPVDQMRQSGLQEKLSISPQLLDKWYGGNLDRHSFEAKAIKHWATKHDVADSPVLGREKFKELHGDAPAQFEIPLPVHQIQTYDQWPKEVGYQPAEKDAVLPNSVGQHSRHGETQVQLRKLVKSLTKLMELRKMLEELDR